MADNQHTFALLANAGRRFDLIYLDPPYNTGKLFTLSSGQSAPTVAFRDSWNGLDGYLAMLEPRLAAARDLLSDTGLLAVHIDFRVHPYVRMQLDRLFGFRGLVNDIVWSYRSGGGTRRSFGFKHDNICLYAKTPGYKFFPDAVRVPYDATIARSRQEQFNPQGKVCPDVWDINRPPNHLLESRYPTAKPVKLISRLIEATTEPGDLVGDFFCGSSASAEAADRLDRRWIVGDSSPVAALHSRLRWEKYAERRLPLTVIRLDEAPLPVTQSTQSGDEPIPADQVAWRQHGHLTPDHRRFEASPSSQHPSGNCLHLIDHSAREFFLAHE